MKLFKQLAVAIAATLALAAQADINVGVTLSATGPAASLGIPEKNTVALMPTTIAGQKVNYIVLDDASDTTTAVANTRKLITENKVDIVIGSTVTPNSLAMIDAVSESGTPMISMAASARIVEPVDAKKRWVFKTPQNDIMMSLAIASHMADAKIKTRTARAGGASSTRSPPARSSTSSPASATTGQTPPSRAKSSSSWLPGPTPSSSPVRARPPRCRRRR
jgi:branched-chain amino acid transport system substrate-binding protein